VSTLQAVTANRLADGAAVFRRADGAWVLRVEEAATASDENAAISLLADSERDAAAALVVGPYLIEVETSRGHPAPTGYRERIRAYGPSRAFHADVPTRHP
jgi:sulfite reductase (NADPH) hemoprotein beta-component